MFWRTRLALGLSLVIGGVSGGIAVAMMTLQIPEQASLRGAALGLAGGLFGAALFTAGALVGRASEARTSCGDARPLRLKKPSISPAEAKFWLQRFLEQHQGKRQA